MTVQPWSRVVWPAELPGSWGPMTALRMKAIPAIGRGLALIEGMAMQMPIDATRGDVVLRRPRILEQPDPTVDRPWFVGEQIDDYLVHGNAVSLVTVRDVSTGWPVAAKHLPAAKVKLVKTPDGRIEYVFGDRVLPAGDVVHVRRGSDPRFLARGMGVLEQYARALGRMDKQGAYEESVLDGAAVPSVVVVTPNDRPSEEELTAASDRWLERFGGPQRRPVFLPAGSEVKPLSWSPSDSQLVEARQLSLTDAANILNLDAFWVGGSISSGLTYRSPGPMWLNLLRQTLNPILEQIEAAWSAAWLPHGQRVRFARDAILAEDKSTTVSWVVRAKSAGLITAEEARVALGYSAELPAGLDDATPEVPAQDSTTLEGANDE